MLLMQEITHIWVINEVKTIKSTDIPSIPSLYLKKFSIQTFSSTNWNSTIWLSKEYHKNKDKIKLINVVNTEIYFALLLSFDFDNSIKKAPTSGAFLLS